MKDEIWADDSFPLSIKELPSPQTFNLRDVAYTFMYIDSQINMQGTTFHCNFSLWAVALREEIQSLLFCMDLVVAVFVTTEVIGNSKEILIFISQFSFFNKTVIQTFLLYSSTL